MKFRIPNSEFRIGPGGPLYAPFVLFRIALLLCFLTSTACVSSSIPDRFDCPGDALADWEVPAGWVDRELTVTDARVEVLTANLSKEAYEAQWRALLDMWRDGDQFWLYKQPAEEPPNALGARRGVVLIRGCTQLGFVTTQIETEPPR